MLAIIPFAFLRHQNKAVKFAIIKTINIVINIGGNTDDPSVAFMKAFPFFWFEIALDKLLIKP